MFASFSNQNFAPTYSAPIYATGEQLRRTRNQAMAQSVFAGNERSTRTTGKGIGAGSGAMNYRTGIAADTAAGQGYAEAQKAAAEQMAANAGTRFQFQTGAADERNTLANLLLGRDSTDQRAMLDNRQIAIGNQVQNRQREVTNETSKLNRKAQIGGILGGLFGA